MTDNFYKIKWFNTNISDWLVDYFYEKDDGDFCILSVKLDYKKYTFHMSKNLAEDIYVLLTKFVNILLKQECLSTDNVKIINLGMSCKGNIISGQFELSINQNLD